MVTPESINKIINDIQSNTRDAIALLRLVADEYEKAHNNVQELVDVYLPGYTPTPTPKRATPNYVPEAVAAMVVGPVVDKPVQDETGNFEVVPGTSGVQTSLNVAAATRKVLEAIRKKDEDFLLKDIYKAVRKSIPDAPNSSMYNAYWHYIKNHGLEAARVMKHDKTYYHLVEKH